MIAAPSNCIEVGLHLIINSVKNPSEKSMVNRWLSEWQKSNFRALRRAKILAAIGEGYDSYAEIAGATEIPEPTVRKIVPKLVSSRAVVIREIKPPGRKMEYRFELAES